MKLRRICLPGRRARALPVLRAARAGMLLGIAAVAGCAEPGSPDPVAAGDGMSLLPASACELLACGDAACDEAAVRCDCTLPLRFDGITCVAPDACVGCADDGLVVWAPRLDPIAEAALPLMASRPADVDFTVSARGRALGPVTGNIVPIGAFGPDEVRVEAGAGAGRFGASYRVAHHYPGPVGDPDSEAVAADSPQIARWAVSVADFSPGAGVDDTWRVPARALGAASSTTLDVVSLGEGGTITLDLGAAVSDAAGPELFVFENAFDDRFLELAYVEVSSDGRTFVRFDSAAHTPEPIGPWGLTDPRLVNGLAGAYRAGWGVPFDLALLSTRPEVVTGAVDLGAIRFVRIVDVVGDGSMVDSFGRPIHDPWPTEQSAGFDLDAVGVAAARAAAR